MNGSEGTGPSTTIVVVAAAAGRAQQQRRHRLARVRGAHLDAPAREAGRLDLERQVAGLAGETEARAGGGQHRRQVAHGPLAHALRAVEAVDAPSGGGDRGQEARRGAGVAHVQFGCCRRDGAAGAPDGDPRLRGLGLDADAEPHQAVQARFGVVAEQRAAQRRAAGRQRRDHQRTVGQALRARHRHRAAHRTGGRRYLVGFHAPKRTPRAARGAWRPPTLGGPTRGPLGFAP